MMSQVINNREIPVQFASHILNERERKYAVNEKEGLACVWAIEHWEKCLLGRKFTLRTDHACLKTLLQQYVNSRNSAKFERWLERLSRFHFEIQHVKGSRGFIPDTPSRLPIASTNSELALLNDEDMSLHYSMHTLSASPVTLKNILQDRQKDTTLQKAIRYTLTSWPTKKTLTAELLPYHIVRHELSIEDDTK